MPIAAKRKYMLGRALAQRVRSAAGEAKLRIHRDLAHDGNLLVTVSPNGKEMLMVARAALVYSPFLPRVVDSQ